MANLALLVPVLFLALFVQSGESVRCFTCSSDLDPSCNDPFLVQTVDLPYRYKLEDCDAHSGVSYPYLSGSKSVCKKQKKYINGAMVISRGCSWKQRDDYSTACPLTNAYNEVSSYCETCEYDGCNGAGAIGKTLALLFAPIALILLK